MEAQVSETKPLFKNPTFWFYGSSSMAYGIKDNAFSYLLLIYSNNCLGVPGYLSGLALALAMVWDAFTDPLLGHWSDKSNTRIGRRHPFMYTSLLLLPGGFYALFNPVVAVSGEEAFVYVLVMAIIIRTGVTLFEVPCTALLPDLVKDYDERNRWLSLRHLFGWTGGNGIHLVNFFFWIGAIEIGNRTFGYDHGFVSPEAYVIYGTVGALIITVVIITASLGTQRLAAKLPQPTETFKISEMFKEIRQIAESLKNGNFAALFFYGLALGAAGGLGSALYLFNVTYFFEFEPWEIGMTAVAVLFAPPVASFFAPKVGIRLGKKHGAIVCLLTRLFLYPIPYIAVLNGFWPDLGSRESLLIYTLFIYVEVVLGIMGTVFLDSMMADIVEDSERKTTRRSEGLFFAARAFAAKFTAASGILGAGIVVSAAGLDAVRSVEQMTMAIRFDIATFFLPLYCSLCLIGIALINLYKIDRESHNANLEALAKLHDEQIGEEDAAGQST